MPHAATGTSSSSFKGAWRPTKVMNMRDLSRDDDFLSHLLVEKLGTGVVPLVVHKMDPTRRLPKSDAEQLLQIVRRLVVAKGPQQTAIRQAVDDLLRLAAVRYYLRTYTQKQINAFATHASRYFELYLPSGSIEIAHTSRYSHRTGKSELCILATRPLAPGAVITELKGSMADLTEEEDKELKQTDERHADGVGIRRDFSVIHSKQLKKNHLFLGPARFVNHDCDHNAELFREGRYITFRVIKPIGVGEEVTAHYGDGYFGRKNRHCLCETCEKKGRGGYAPHNSDDEDISDSGEGSSGEAAGTEEEQESSSSDEDDGTHEGKSVNVNERRTRRGVYAILPDEQSDTEESGQMELDAEVEPDNSSELTSLPPSRSSAPATRSRATGLMTPDPEPVLRGRLATRQVETASTPSSSRKPPSSLTSISVSTPFKSIISTRSQKAREASSEISVSRSRKGKEVAGRSISAARQLVTPPLTAENSGASAANSVRSSSRIRSRGAALLDKETVSSRLSTPVKNKGKARVSASISDVRDTDKDEPERDTRSLRPRVPVVNISESISAKAKKMEDRPRGLDGKPLPTCSTCSNVLPVISVDSEVVWGLAPTTTRTGKRGRPRKRQDMECPRCIRHFEIYNLKWPERIPSDGTKAFLPAPREVPKAKVVKAELSVSSGSKVTHKNLATVNHKLTASSTSKSISTQHPTVKRKRDEDVGEVRPTKKQKTPPTTFRPSPGRPPKAKSTKTKVGMSAEAKKMLNATGDGRRSGRNRIPTLKLRESEPPIAKLRVSPRKNPSSSSSLSTLPSSDDPVVGQSTPTKNSGSSSSSDEKNKTPKSKAVACQPRESNGRFGKKANSNGRFVRKTVFHLVGKRYKRPKRSGLQHRLAQVPVKREEDDWMGKLLHEDGDEEDEEEGTLRRRHSGGEPSSDLLTPEREIGSMELSSVLGKRSRGGEHFEDELAKRLHRDEMDTKGDEDGMNEDEDDEEFLPPSPLTAIVKVGTALLGRPNPAAFARRKWAPVHEEEDSDDGLMYTDESDPPVTPEDHAEISVISSHDYTDEEDEEDQDNESTISPSSNTFVRAPAFAGHLGFNPNPMNLSRRRWAPPPEPKPKAVEEEVSPPRLSGKLPVHPILEMLYQDSEHSLSPEPELRLPAESSSIPSHPPRALHPSLAFWRREEEEEGQAEEEEEDDDDMYTSEEESYPGELLYPYDYSDEEQPSETINRISAPSPLAVDLTDDSERIVERLVAISSDSRPTSSLDVHESIPGTPPSSRPRPSLLMDNSPGLAWKRTVLIPTDDTSYLTKATISISGGIPKSPTKLVGAGWDPEVSSDIDSR